MGERCNHSGSYAGFSFRNVSGTEGWGGADTEISEWHKVFSPSLKKHFYSSYCVFCYLGTDSLQHTPKISKEIKQPMFAKNCSVGFFFVQKRTVLKWLLLIYEIPPIAKKAHDLSFIPLLNRQILAVIWLLFLAMCSQLEHSHAHWSEDRILLVTVYFPSLPRWI